MSKTAHVLFIAVLIGASFSAIALYGNEALTVTPLVKTTSSWNGAPVSYPDGQAEITGMMIEIAPGGETGWHLHTVPSFAMVTEGAIEVHLKNGKVQHVKAGEGLVEVVNTLHNGYNKGDVPAKLVVFYAGAVDSKLTLMEAEAAAEKL